MLINHIYHPIGIKKGVSGQPGSFIHIPHHPSFLILTPIITDHFKVEAMSAVPHSDPHPGLGIVPTHSPSNTNPNTVDNETLSRTDTAVDLQAHREGEAHKNGWVAAEEAPVKPLADYEAREEGVGGAEVKLSQSRKWFLLFIFSVAQVSPFRRRVVMRSEVG